MAKLKVNVDITSDIMCPWCYIGKKHLDIAMKHLSDDFDFHIQWRPFLLDHSIPEEGVHLMDYFKRRFGDAQAALFVSPSNPIQMQGKSLGIDFNYNDRLVVPTKKGHMIADFALKKGKQHEMQEVLFNAYFTRTLSEEVLKELVAEVGLDPAEAMAALSDPHYLRQFEKGLQRASANGITSVPTFEFSVADRPEVKQTFPGAQSVDTIVAVCARLKSQAKI